MNMKYFGCGRFEIDWNDDGTATIEDETDDQGRIGRQYIIGPAGAAQLKELCVRVCLEPTWVRKNQVIAYIEGCINA